MLVILELLLVYVNDAIYCSETHAFKMLFVCSGEEVGPLLLEIPLVTVGVSTNNCRVLADKLNVCDNSGKQAVDLACEVSGLSTRTESCLLDKVSTDTL